MCKGRHSSTQDIDHAPSREVANRIDADLVARVSTTFAQALDGLQTMIGR
jgi:hypothetical protein